tara:strand:- start:142 stop:1119 length:978 start_codon:yes stop_codon:yes gene_type:complete
MVLRFNIKYLEKLNKNDFYKLKINQNIILDKKFIFCDKLNAKIINIHKNKLHVRYYNNNNFTMITNNKDCLYGLDIVKYNYNNFRWIKNNVFIEKGFDDIIDINNTVIYKPYNKYPFYSCSNNLKYGNKYVIEYYNSLQKINMIKTDHYNLNPSITYCELPKILNSNLAKFIKDPIRINNNYNSVLGCIIKGLPKIIKKKVEIDSYKNIEKYYKKFVILHMNNSFIKHIEKKYNIPYDSILSIKYQLEENIIDNFLLAIICSEIFKINIKIYKYIDYDNIELFDINDSELIKIIIYNTCDIYELIISRKLYRSVKNNKKNIIYKS